MQVALRAYHEVRPFYMPPSLAIAHKHGNHLGVILSPGYRQARLETLSPYLSLMDGPLFRNLLDSMNGNPAPSPLNAPPQNDEDKEPTEVSTHLFL